MTEVSVGAVADDLKIRAVVDIGSNSVRMVIYGGPPRAPVSIFNEKVLCGLGQRDIATGTLRQEAVEEALAVLRRFKALIDDLRPEEIHVVATAAAREAPNGPQFLDDIRAIGLPVRLLTGREEARFAALGILAGCPEILDDAHGALAGDIGGGSLEISHIDPSADGFVGDSVSLPLGALRLSSEFEGDRAAARRHIRQQIAGVSWLKNCPATTLEVVGGAWRGIARIGITESRYPLDVLDRYGMTLSDIIRLCQHIASLPVKAIELMPNVQRRRAPTLPYAAIVLEELLNAASVQRFEVSASGVREGLLFEDLTADAQRQNPLIATARHLSRNPYARLRPPSAVLVRLITELMGTRARRPMDSPADSPLHRWLEAAAILSSLYASTHPDERARQAGVGTLALPLRGVSHEGRVFIAATLSVSHGASAEDIARWLPMSLLKPAVARDTVIAGLAMRFFLALSPMGATGLEGVEISVTDDRLYVRLDDAARKRWGRAPERRLSKLAAAMDVEPRVD